MATPDLADLTESDPPHYYRLELPRWQDERGYLVLPWLTENQKRRQPWYAYRAVIGRWRLWGFKHGQRLGLDKPLPRARVVAELRFVDRRVRDPSNWSSTAKAVIDGLVDAGVFPGDDHRYVVGPDMRVGACVPAGTSELLIVHIWRQQ